MSVLVTCSRRYTILLAFGEGTRQNVFVCREKTPTMSKAPRCNHLTAEGTSPYTGIIAKIGNRSERQRNVLGHCPLDIFKCCRNAAYDLMGYSTPTKTLLFFAHFNFKTEENTLLLSTTYDVHALIVQVDCSKNAPPSSCQLSYANRSLQHISVLKAQSLATANACRTVP